MSEQLDLLSPTPWAPNRTPLNRNVAPAPAPMAPKPWKDQPGVRRRSYQSEERKNLVQRLIDGSLTGEGYARELIENDRRLGRG